MNRVTVRISFLYQAVHGDVEEGHRDLPCPNRSTVPDVITRFAVENRHLLVHHVDITENAAVRRLWARKDTSE